MTKVDQDQQFVRGWVDYGAECITSEIGIYKTDGELLNTGTGKQPLPTPTQSERAFLEPIIGKPDRLTIVVQCAYCTDNLVATLKARVEDYNPAQDIVYVSPLTTLLHAYHDRFPESEGEQAQDHIKRFLALPETIDLNQSLDETAPYFNINQFLLQASVMGGVEQLYQQLLDEMEADPEATHPFLDQDLDAGLVEKPGEAITDRLLATPIAIQTPAALATPGGGSGFIGYFGDKLAAGCISYLGGQTLGWALNEAGLSFPDATQQALEEIKQDLKEIKKMLNGLKVQLDNVYSSLYKEIEKTNYGIRVGQLNTLISTVKNTWRDLVYLAVLDLNEVKEEEREKTKQWILKEKERIKTIIGEKLLPQLGAIHNQQAGLAGGEGLIEVWSKVVASRHRFLDEDDSATMHAQFDFFDSLQLALFGLVIEYYHEAMPPGLAKDKLEPLIEDYKNHRDKQLSMKTRQIPPKAIIDTRTGLLISPYTIWEDAPKSHFGNQFACVLPWRNKKPVAQASPYFAGSPYNIRCKLPQNSQFGRPLMGFTNWRMATTDEAKNMFLGWEGSSVHEWAEKEGYPQGCLNAKVEMFLTNHEGFHDPNYNQDKTLECWKMPMTNGVPTMIECTWPGRTGGNSKSYKCLSLESTKGPKGDLIPVRTTGEDEIYFY